MKIALSKIKVSLFLHDDLQVGHKDKFCSLIIKLAQQLYLKDTFIQCDTAQKVQKLKINKLSNFKGKLQI